MYITTVAQQLTTRPGIHEDVRFIATAVMTPVWVEASRDLVEATPTCVLASTCTAKSLECGWQGQHCKLRLESGTELQLQDTLRPAW